MIALLRGTVAASSLGLVVVDVAGVGYEVHVPPAAGVPVTGSQVTLHTYLAVREDALTLYGFLDAGARGLFAAMLSVTGVGPKLALAAIGTLGADGLRRAVITEDVSALTVIPGVGKKSAQRMVLELREKLGASGGDGVPGATMVPGAPPGARHDVRQALAGLGYAPSEVAAALETLPDDDEATPEQLLRAALRALGRK
ncbi:MAG: Holliday junction branch migration protein RuvA [Actinomycetota bacterium]|jgi:Holliday junction DNA helicase RuvA|nr:Holliday junction branch migration protein RuvA [Euzebyaceae bacterium]MDQ3453621.1 Holliday junction branch migration protein RuvA [Actinomycetota bacterium]